MNKTIKNRGVALVLFLLAGTGSLLPSNSFAGRRAKTPSQFSTPFHCFQTATPRIISDIKAKSGYNPSKLQALVNKLVVATDSASCHSAFKELVTYKGSL